MSHPSDSVVVVVGAGVSGLVTAQVLLDSRPDLTVDIVDAKDYVGGRVRTVKIPGDSPPACADLGGAWIHGTEGSPLVEAFPDIMKPSVPVADNPWMRPTHEGFHAVVGSGPPLTPAEFESGTAEFKRWLDAQGRLPVSDRSITFPPGVALPSSSSSPAAFKTLFLHWRLKLVEVWMGAGLPCLNAEEFDEDDGWGDYPGVHSVMGSPGMQALVLALLKNLGCTDTKLAQSLVDGIAGDASQSPRPRVAHITSRLRIHLNTPVVAVKTGRGAGDVVTLSLGPSRTLHADAVVLTMSPPVLASLPVSPPLPDPKLRACAAIKLGQYRKVILRFPTRCGTFKAAMSSAAKPLLAQLDPDATFPLFVNYWHIKGSSYPIVVGVLVGAAFQRHRHKSDAALGTMAHESLCRIVGHDLPQPCTVVVTKWEDDPWVQGAYSYYPAGCSPDHFDALSKPCGRLFFAGGATDIGTQGSLVAALLSGRRAAKELLHTLPPPAKSPPSRHPLTSKL